MEVGTLAKIKLNNNFLPIKHKGCTGKDSPEVVTVQPSPAKCVQK